ncbi:MAG: MucB/RseB C-terminal domain-containing protein [Proteobacteria bacterium]|nr:MucB/RseB C-terminal domain-containing protein [Pseudomonadota bacterium]
MSLWLGFFICWIAVPILAWGATSRMQPENGIAWLKRSALAAHHLDYQGIFIYQHGRYIETSRIIHSMGTSGERERLESLDRTPRVIIRTSQNIRYYNLKQHTEMIEPLPSAGNFPSVFADKWLHQSQYYHITLGQKSRYSGLSCQRVNLTPIDDLRYTRHMCIALKSGLLLHESVINNQKKPIEEMTFTELRIGGPIKRSMIFDGLGGNWQIKQSSLEKTMAGSVPFSLNPLPPGFHKIAQVMRNIPGRSQPVEHLIYSDGFTAVSLFIEPAGSDPVFRIGLSHAGVMHVYTRLDKGYTITALGEVPAVTVTNFARAVRLFVSH